MLPAWAPPVAELAEEVLVQEEPEGPEAPPWLATLLGRDAVPWALPVVAAGWLPWLTYLTMLTVTVRDA